MKADPQLGTLFRWWWLLLAGAALGAGAALIAVRATAPVYRAASTLFVISPSDSSLNQSFARTYAQMAVHPVVLQRVGEILALPLSVNRLEGMISARPIPDTQLVEIVVQANEAALARDIANAAAHAFIEQQAAQLPAGPAGPSLRIGQPAVTPDQPVGARPPLPAVALGVLVGALFAVGVARLLDAPKPVPAPLTPMPARQPARAPVPETAPAPTIDERMGMPDVVRGVVVLAIAVTALLVPLAATGGVRLLASSSAPPEQATTAGPSVVQAARSSAPQSALVAPIQPVGQEPIVTDLPVSAVIPAAGSERTAAGVEAEIAGATSAASPELAAARAPSFAANFDGQQAWPNDPAGPARLQDGAYRITPRTPDQFVGIGAPFSQPLRDVAVTASFQKVGGPPGGVYGVILRDAGPSPRDGYNQVGNFYVLGVNDRGQYAVWRREGERWLELVPLTPSDAVHAGTEMNEINVHAVDDRISLSVNGVEVATVLGAQARPGTVGIYVGGDSNDVLVSRFQIEPIPASAESTSSPPSAPASPTAQAPEVAGAVESRPSESRSTTTQALTGFTLAVLREAPATSSRALASLPNGAAIEVLPETASGDGFTWLRARTGDGVLGWIVSAAVTD